LIKIELLEGKFIYIHISIHARRYFAVTNVNYMHTRSERQIGIMIAMVWGVAVIVSVAPILGWKDPEFKDRVLVQKKCLVSQDLGYQVCSTIFVPFKVLVSHFLVIFFYASWAPLNRV
jgi:5-hydroxytryptamine receptor 1